MRTFFALPIVLVSLALFTCAKAEVPKTGGPTPTYIREMLIQRFSNRGFKCKREGVVETDENLSVVIDYSHCLLPNGVSPQHWGKETSSRVLMFRVGGQIVKVDVFAAIPQQDLDKLVDGEVNEYRYLLKK
jgi:hypothetical protein